MTGGPDATGDIIPERRPFMNPITSAVRKAMTLLFLVVLLIAMTGCGAGPKEQIGAVLGAGLGGLAGSFIGDGQGQLIAVAAGTLAGGFLGSEVGKSLDKADMAYLKATQQQALETVPDGRGAAWENPNSGNAGYTVPTATYQAADGRYCREFQQTVIIGDQSETAYGTACRQPDGSWQIVG